MRVCVRASARVPIPVRGCGCRPLRWPHLLPFPSGALPIGAHRIVKARTRKIEAAGVDVRPDERLEGGVVGGDALAPHARQERLKLVDAVRHAVTLGEDVERAMAQGVGVLRQRIARPDAIGAGFEEGLRIRQTSRHDARVHARAQRRGIQRQSRIRELNP